MSRPIQRNPQIHSRKKRDISANDVAQLAGVSQSTVSRVLNKVQSDLISEETRERVLEAARHLGYTPNPIARALRGKKSCLLGVIVRDIGDPFFASFVAELTSQARRKDYHIVLGHAGSNPEEALEITNILDTRHTDGVFLLGDLKGDESALQEMLRFTHALVALCRGTSPASVYTINTDNFAGTNLVMDHLFKLEHRNIGFLDGGWLGDIRERREAYIAYIKQQGLPFKEEWIQTEKNDSAGGYRAMRKILALSDRPTAVFVSDDMMAIGAMKAVSDVGLHIPDDISVAGFDNVDMSGYCCPALTTVSQPIEEMADRALRLMIQLIDEPDDIPEKKVMRLIPKLIVRQSTGVAPKLVISKD
jgi:DNA-binding LacI/PurR family transcriptional regulator